MDKLKTQFGKSTMTDFWKKEWTFQMPHDFKVNGGEFAIIPKEDYDNIIERIKNIKEYAVNYEIKTIIEDCNNILK